MSESVSVWSLKRGGDRRLRAGHPWVFSNELADSPRGVAPGEAVELRDAGGRFVARGDGNPASLIAFRVRSTDPAETDPWSQAALLARIEQAGALRAGLGLGALSHRLVF